MADTATKIPIATTTLGSASGSVGFSSIPSIYTDLILVANTKLNSGTDTVKLYLNSDDNPVYSSTRLKGNGTSATSTRTSNQYGSGGGAPFGEVTTEWGNFIISIQNYSNSTTYKTALTRTSFASNAAFASVVLYRSTSAITSVNVNMNTGSFVADSAFTLYGIL